LSTALVFLLVLADWLGVIDWSDGKISPPGCQSPAGARRRPFRAECRRLTALCGGATMPAMDEGCAAVRDETAGPSLLGAVERGLSGARR
jgi:hypothetical protein